MAQTTVHDEQEVREDLARLVTAAVTASGRRRGDIARDAGVHKDAFRRVLCAQRSATVGEAVRILSACGLPPQAHLLLLLNGQGDRAVAWLDDDLTLFLDGFVRELPCALERALGHQLHEVKPRWAKGTAQRVARLISDHIDELERRDALSFGDD